MTEDKNMEEQILEAAKQLFIEQGFAKTTTGQIAEYAGCNQALVHYYYRTKDKLFDKIFEEKAEIILSNFLETRGKEGTFEERLAEKIRTHFDFLKENSKLPMFIYNEILMNLDRIKSFDNRLKSISKNIIESLEMELQEEIDKGNIHPISVVDLLFTIICLNITPFLLQPIVQSVLELDEQQLDKMLEQRKEETVLTILGRLKL